MSYVKQIEIEKKYMKTGGKFFYIMIGKSVHFTEPTEQKRIQISVFQFFFVPEIGKKLREIE
jgi:hypothetical protein